jgi:hypothetical protein
VVIVPWAASRFRPRWSFSITVSVVVVQYLAIAHEPYIMRGAERLYGSILVVLWAAAAGVRSLRHRSTTSQPAPTSQRVSDVVTVN